MQHNLEIAKMRAQFFAKFANCVNIAAQSINDLYRVHNFKIALHNFKNVVNIDSG